MVAFGSTSEIDLNRKTESNTIIVTGVVDWYIGFQTSSSGRS